MPAAHQIADTLCFVNIQVRHISWAFCSAISGQQTNCFYLADWEQKNAEYPDNLTWSTELGTIGSRKIVPKVLLDPVVGLDDVTTLVSLPTIEK